jgi:hypothetical protein
MSSSEALVARIAALEKEVADLRKEKSEIFHAWTKDDFIHILENRLGKVGPLRLERLWVRWLQFFSERWDCSDESERMDAILDEMLESDEFVE